MTMMMMTNICCVQTALGNHMESLGQTHDYDHDDDDDLETKLPVLMIIMMIIIMMIMAMMMISRRCCGF